MELKDVVSSVIALVAVVIAWLALRHANSSADAAEKANTLAQEANSVAKEALDMQLEIDRRSWVSFEFNQRGRSRYELRHTGTKTAACVVVDIGDLGFDDDPPVKEFGDFKPGRVEPFMLHGGFDPDNEKVRVHWVRPDGERESQEFLID
ncbi:hypothetical protein [Arthrobacter sp. Leaf137]|uniref:hypothetical protein n=1 Tax=Arthrobacter sp. Leaf137 TaxID=1736271 RepID=UPI000701E53F|nr:hypothetical protein [Arthrobacter sp. Leaf137]KQQ89459.1 hypothetical protein ASF64_17630 [Arthrobacter sp. Leaf137]